jgi:hypothetical protein
LQFVSREWRASLADLVTQADQLLLLATPYIKYDAAEWLIDTLSSRGRQPPSQTTIMTDISPGSTLSASLDVGALLLFAGSLQGVTIYDVQRLHAKVYVAYDKRAIVTSGNLTPSAFARNHEYGVVVTDREMVRRVYSDMQDYARLGRQISRDELVRLNEASRDVVAKYQRSAERLGAGIRRELAIEWDKIAAHFGAPSGLHEIGSARFKGPIVEALASRGPLTTRELCQAIRDSCPYLCDDTLMRTAKDGSRKRQWRHDVHTAQETLQRAGVLLRDATGLWHLQGR